MCRHRRRRPAFDNLLQDDFGALLDTGGEVNVHEGVKRHKIVRSHARRALERIGSFPVAFERSKSIAFLNQRVFVLRLALEHGAKALKRFFVMTIDEGATGYGGGDTVAMTADLQP